MADEQKVREEFKKATGEKLEVENEELSELVSEAPLELASSGAGVPEAHAFEPTVLPGVTEPGVADALVKEQQRAQEEMTSEEALMSVADRKARIAQALERGLMASWLEVRDLPSDLRAAFVRETREDIAKFRMMGYEIETRYGKQYADHSTGDGVRRFGDCVLMTTPMENYELIQEVQAERKALLANVGIEEFVNQSQADAKRSGVRVPLINESEDAVRSQMST